MKLFRFRHGAEFFLLFFMPFFYAVFCTFIFLINFRAVILDALFIITIMWSLYFGYVNGPIKVFLYIISLMAAIVAAMVFTPTVAQLLRETFVTQSPYMPFLGLVMTFMVVLAVMRLISNMLLNVGESGYVNFGVQALGSFIMAALYAFFFSVIVTFLSRDARVIDPIRLKESSVFYKNIEEIPTYGKAFLKATTPFVDGFIDYIDRSIVQLNNGGRRPTRFTNTETVDSLDFDDDTPINLELDSTITVTPE
jgi:uncharacterized membrane protein required for colicin V production